MHVYLTWICPLLIQKNCHQYKKNVLHHNIENPANRQCMDQE